MALQYLENFNETDVEPRIPTLTKITNGKEVTIGFFKGLGYYKGFEVCID